jgi:hypothetical protein
MTLVFDVLSELFYNLQDEREEVKQLYEEMTELKMISRIKEFTNNELYDNSLELEDLLTSIEETQKDLWCSC